MNKKPKIKIIKYNTRNSESCTFLNHEFSSTTSSDMQEDDRKFDENTGAEQFDKLHKKKRGLIKEDMAKSSKGLKFTKPSQRNHSSIYE